MAHQALASLTPVIDCPLNHGWISHEILRIRHDCGAIGAQPIDRRRRSRRNPRPTAEQHQARIDAQELDHLLVPNGPGLLRAGFQPLLARQQHDVLDEHAEIGPLRRSHRAVEEKKHPDGRTEEIVVSSELAMPRRPIFARNADEPIQILAVLVAARAVGLLQFGRIHVILGAAAKGRGEKLAASIVRESAPWKLPTARARSTAASCRPMAQIARCRAAGGCSPGSPAMR